MTDKSHHLHASNIGVEGNLASEKTESDRRYAEFDASIRKNDSNVEEAEPYLLTENDNFNGQ